MNGLFYGRGSAAVYDHWEKLGNPGWAWNDVYPEFIRVSFRFMCAKSSSTDVVPLVNAFQRPHPR